MTINDIKDYVDSDDRAGLIKIEPTIELGEVGNEFYITKTKETYNFYTEMEADVKINNVRELKGFAKAEKKFKPGKINKAGEEVRPDIYQVVIVLNY